MYLRLRKEGGGGGGGLNGKLEMETKKLMDDFGLKP